LPKEVKKIIHQEIFIKMGNLAFEDTMVKLEKQIWIYIIQIMGMKNHIQRFPIDIIGIIKMGN